MPRILTGQQWINIKTTLLKLWLYYVKYRVLKRYFL